jgi:hypothetical protein
VAREITVEVARNALGRVNYPGYATDIVSLGVIEAVDALATGGGFAVVVRQATERDEVMHELAGAINRTLTRELGVPRHLVICSVADRSATKSPAVIASGAAVVAAGGWGVDLPLAAIENGRQTPRGNFLPFFQVQELYNSVDWCAHPEQLSVARRPYPE